MFRCLVDTFSPIAFSSKLKNEKDSFVEIGWFVSSSSHGSFRFFEQQQFGILRRQLRQRRAGRQPV
jgi:hypothetical protein